MVASEAGPRLLRKDAVQQGILGRSRSSGQSLKIRELTPNPNSEQSATRPGVQYCLEKRHHGVEQVLVDDGMCGPSFSPKS
jgi:hypothetical protein